MRLLLARYAHFPPACRGHFGLMPIWTGKAGRTSLAFPGGAFLPREREETATKTCDLGDADLSEPRKICCSGLWGSSPPTKRTSTAVQNGRLFDANQQGGKVNKRPHRKQAGATFTSRVLVGEALGRTRPTGVHFTVSSRAAASVLLLDLLPPTVICSFVSTEQNIRPRVTHACECPSMFHRAVPFLCR